MKKDYYIKIDGIEVPVTEEVYRAYWQPAWAEHKRDERAKRCRDKNGVRCDKDCRTCSNQRSGSDLSLDKFSETGFDIADPRMAIDEIVSDRLLLDMLLAALDELAENDRNLIHALFYEELSERDLARKTGVPRKTLAYRKKKILEKLKKILEKNL